MFAQTSPPQEIIVVDDASPDETADVVESAARRAPVPVRLIRMPTNSGGPAKPINVGVGAASGEFITVLDQDDVFLPNRVEEHLRVFAHDPNLNLAFGCCGIVGVPGEIAPNAEIRSLLSQASRPLTPELPGWSRIDGSDLLRLLLWKNCFISGYPGFTFRKRDWSAKAGVDTSLKIASDYDFLCWLSSCGNAGYSPEPLYRRRIHEDNVTGNHLQTNLEGAAIRERYLSAHPRLLAHQDLRDELYAWFLGFGYWLREANRPWLALRLYCSAARLFGWDAGVILGLTKVLPMAAVYRLTRRPPQYVKMTRSGSSKQGSPLNAQCAAQEGLPARS